MSVQIYGGNHLALEGGDLEQAVALSEDVFGMKKLDEDEGAFLEVQTAGVKLAF